jgi:hypothetical protein
VGVGVRCEEEVEVEVEMERGDTVRVASERKLAVGVGG